MKRPSHLYIRRHNNEPALFPTDDPKLGQRLDIWMSTGFEFVRATIWYHPNDWRKPDFQTLPQ